MSDPLITRNSVRTTIGVEVASLDVSFLVNANVMVAGIPFTQFVENGGLDGAIVSLDRHYAADWVSYEAGNLNVFYGRVADLQITDGEVRMTVNSDMELLNVQMPRNVYCAQCMHTLFDSGCQLNATTYTLTGTVTGNSSTQTSIVTSLSNPDDYFTLGTLLFTSGQNAGVGRSVRAYAGAVVTPVLGLPYAPAAGDTFTIKPGCDKTDTTCNGKFGNKANFRGYPLIPVPEAAY